MFNKLKRELDSLRPYWREAVLFSWMFAGPPVTFALGLGIGYWAWG